MSNTKKASEEQMQEMFEEIVEEIKKNGCKVDIKKKLAKIQGSNGFFCSEPTPHIKVALLNKPWPKVIELIIHEYCHYWQWKDGFLDRQDDDGNIIYSKILEGKEVTPDERKKASTLVRISEYDCEIRTGSLFAPYDKGWNLESIFSKEDHIKSANTYNRHIIWSIGDENNKGSGIFLHTYDKLAPKLWGSTTFTSFWNPWTSAGMDKILAPLSASHKKIFDKALEETIDEALGGENFRNHKGRVKKAAKKLDMPVKLLNSHIEKITARRKF